MTLLFVFAYALLGVADVLGVSLAELAELLVHAAARRATAPQQARVN